MIVPGLMLLVTYLFVTMEMQGPLFNTIVLVGGGILGLILGMIIAKLTKLKIAKDGSLLMRGSFIAMGLWFLLVLAKLYGQDTLNQWGVDADLFLSLFLMISVTTMIAERIGIYYRYLKKRKGVKKKNRGKN
jgi:membrane protein CcdC involved in cytochrome C biogenesis